MYLSCLQIDSERPAGRHWLANPYRVHQRLCMAYPEGEAGRVLFRIEAGNESPRVIVQAPQPASWEQAFGKVGWLAAPPLQKELNLRFHPGQRLRFLLVANPTRRAGSAAVIPGKRQGLVHEAEQRDWLERKGETGGFRPLGYEVRSLGLVTCRRGPDGGAPAMTLTAVEMEGYLVVAEPVRFSGTVAAGLGSAKGLGFGLLSLAPA